ncbi:MAG: NAD-dependent epimerase/dehydratase family protein [Phycisphaeraceae bacterium]
MLVTGAAGTLGRPACRQLARSGHQVRAADVVGCPDLPADVQITTDDLRDPGAAKRLVEGCDAVVHLATSSASSAEPVQIYTDNVTMNAHVFHAAARAGVRRLIYASSTQIFSGDRRGNEPYRPSVLPYLPLDEKVPPHPGNAYAASKEAGEALLRYYARLTPQMTCTAVRWPLLASDQKVRWFRDRQPADGPDPANLLDVGFSFLAIADAVDFIETLLEKAPPGYECFFPTSEENRLGWPVWRIAKLFYPNVPLRKPLDEMEQLVDHSAILNKLGWRPSHSSLS